MSIEYAPRPLESLAPGQLVRIKGLRHVLRGVPALDGGVFERVDATRKRTYSSTREFEPRPLAGIDEAAKKAAHTLICRLPKRTGRDHQRFTNQNLSLGIQFGSDPEMFLLDAKGKLMSAFLFLPKKSENKGFFWDGFQAEVTPQAHACAEVSTGNVKQCVLNMKQFIGENSLRILPSSTAEIPEDQLSSAKQEFVQLGCDPSQNIYGAAGAPVGDPRKLKQRWAGGHIHMSLLSSKGQFNMSFYPGVVEEAIKTLDIVLGVPSVLLAQGWDTSDRRKYYGLAGEFRLPPHGIEYRTLSNFWLHHRSLAHLVFGLARAAYTIALEGKRQLFEAPEELVQGIINTCDAREAAKLMKANQEQYFDAFQAAYGWGEQEVPKTFKFILDCEQQGGFSQRYPYEKVRWEDRWSRMVWWSTWMANNHIRV